MTAAVDAAPSRYGQWARFITPGLFLIMLTVHGVALTLLLSAPADPVRWFACGFVALNLLWLALEVPITFRVPSRPPREVGTLLAYGGTRIVLVGSALLGPLPWTAVTALAALPVLAFACGVALRQVAMRELGRFYSHHVIRHDDHAIVRNGPYRLVRHPAYAGMILGHLGLVAFFANPVSVPVFLVLVGVIVWRIRVEERALLVLPTYREFAEGKARLLPGVW